MADITITEGDTLEVDYSLENTGDGTGTFDPRLLIQGVQEDQDTGITLDPAQTATGTLQWPTVDGDAVTDATAAVATDDTSDSITVTVESAIPDSVVYYPESGDLSHFSGDTGSYDITSAAPTSAETGLSLKGQADGATIFSDSGLPSYPTRGDRFSMRSQLDAADGDVIRMGFNAASTTDFAFVQLQADVNTIDIHGPGGQVAEQSYTVAGGEAFYQVVEWQSDDTIVYEVYREGDDPETDQPDASISGTISPNTSGGSVDTGVVLETFNRDGDASDLAMFDYWVRNEL